MPRTFNIHVNITREGGEPVSGFPFNRRVTVDEAQGFDYEKADGGGFVAVPTSELAELVLLALKSDKDVTLRLDGQSDAGIVLKAGGLVLLVNVDIDDGAATNLTIDNQSGATAIVKGFAGGT